AFFVGFNARAKALNTAFRRHCVHNNLGGVVARNIPQHFHAVELVFLVWLILIAEREILNMSLVLGHIFLSGQNLVHEITDNQVYMLVFVAFLSIWPVLYVLH